MHDSDEVTAIRSRLAELEAERVKLSERLRALNAASLISNGISNASQASEKIALFRRLFAGRQDIFPIRWNNSNTGKSGYSPACHNEWVKGTCRKPQVKCAECPNQAFIAVTDQTIAGHLRGTEQGRAPNAEFVAGLYPLLPHDTCRILAADFDGEHWSADALAFLETCQLHHVPAALERSRSGEGGHVWIFFAKPIPARDARQLGTYLMTETMERRPEIGFDSYDRFFPSQDTLPSGGFGNLIALPLQRRARDYGNSVFVDEKLLPFEDQWAFLASIVPMELRDAYGLLDQAVARDRVLAVRMPIADESSTEPWRLPPSRDSNPAPITGCLPERVKIVLADGVYIDRTALPPSMTARLLRVAAFQNPEFYRAQAMRLPTYGKPRIVSCASLHRKHIALPRGCLDESLDLLRGHHVEPDIEDLRERGSLIECQFLGTLRPEQTTAVDALADHDCGVLAATTAFGKTVVAAALIARRQCNTLILVHRKELLTQWVERLREFLSLNAKEIGTIAGGKRKPTGHVDVAIIQSLVRKGEVSDLIAEYGQLIVDECHHLSASSFELVARRSKAKYVLGLSATVTRKDGHQPIIFMQCGPVRHRVDPRAQAMRRTFDHKVRIRQTDFQLSDLLGDRVSMPGIYAALAQDEARNAAIFDDVLKALKAGRSPLVLTERRDHLESLSRRFQNFARNKIVLHGGLTAVQRRSALETLRNASDQERLVLATGRYLGEGFDDPRLDTLFLVMPISWKGTLAQYVGRLHRDYDGKREVVVYDYVDINVPVLARMAKKRETGYRSLGYEIAG